MYIKAESTSYVVNYTCDCCKNNDICSYVKDKTEIDNLIKELKEKLSFNSPLTINSTCKRFEQKPMTRNSFSYKEKNLYDIQEKLYK